MSEVMTDKLAVPIPTKDPDISMTHNYLGFGRVESSCMVEIWLTDDKRAFVLFTEIDYGTSVTNAAEILVEEIYLKYLKDKGVDSADCMFMETYPHALGMIDLVIPEWHGDKVVTVSWRHLGKRIE